MSVFVDSSTWIDFFSGRSIPDLERALAGGSVVLAPVVLAELISGARTPRQRRQLHGLVDALPLHQTTREHWIKVGELRCALSDLGIAVSTPDAHVAQCALDRGAVLLSRDKVFVQIARHSALRLIGT